LAAPMSTIKLAQSLLSKMQTLGWYARRPSLHRELLRKLLRGQISTAASLQRRDEEKRQGQSWCATVASSLETLCAGLGLPPTPKEVAELHPSEWTEACRTVAACPVKMGGPAGVSVLYHLVRYLPARRVLETGVASGWSTLAMLLAMREVGEGLLLSIDMPYAKLNNERYVGCAVPDSLRTNWRLVRRSDRDALEPALAELGHLDLAHYDSDKSHAGRSFAYPKLWAALREGGLLVSDDIEDNLAFRDFAAAQGCKPWVLLKKPGNYVGVLVKPGTR
jgi:predicted O-methyltransferase YrrM